MKSITEFPHFKLVQGILAKAALTTEGKTPEEISTSLGTTFKMEGDKLKYFMAACDVAAANMEKLVRVLIVGLNEGETVPAKAVKVEETYYVPEFLAPPKPPADPKAEGKSGKGGGRKGGPGGGGGGKPKGSPWGISPEEKAAKLAASKKAKSTPA